MASTASDSRGGGDPLRQIARGSLVSGVGALVAAVGGVLFTLAVARAYRPELAGTFFASTAFFLIVAALAQLGTDVGLVRYVSAHAATGQRHRLGETLRIALIPVVALSSLCAVAMWFVAPALADWIGRAGVIDDTITVLRSLTPFVPVTAVYGALLAATRGRGSMKYTVMIDSVLRTAAQPVLFLITVWLGLGPGWGAVAWATPYVIGVVVAAVVLRREAKQAKRLHEEDQLSVAEQTAQMASPVGISGPEDGVETLPSGDQPEFEPLEVPGHGLWRDFWAFTAARAVAGTVVMIWKRFDVLLVAALSGPADAAIYTAATRFLVVGNLGIMAVQMTVSPQLGKLFAQHDLPGARRVYRTATMWTMTFTWPLYITTAAAVGLLIPIFGPEYDAGSSSVVVLSAAMLVATACGSVDAVLLMSGRSLLSLGNAVLTLAVNVVLDIVLIPKFGILGAAIGWALSIAFRNLLALVQINALMKMWPFTRWSGVIGIAAMACFAVLPGILTLADAPNVWIVLALAVGAVAYLAFGYVLRRQLQLDTFINSARDVGGAEASEPTRPLERPMLKVATDGWADAVSGRRVVVTGGAGFLGVHLCTALIDAGAEVVCIDNLSSGSRDRLQHLDGHNLFTLVERDVVESCEVVGQVDLVLHLACVASPPAYQRQPIATLRSGSEGTLNALELARSKQARFVLTSTSEVYGDPAVSPQSEEYWGNVNPVGPRSMYDEAKRFAEALTVACADEWDLPVAIVRIFNTYGPGMHPYDGRIVSTFARQALAGEPITIHGDGSQTRSLCHVSDTVRGVLLMAVSSHRGPVNLGNPDERTVLQLAEIVADLAGSAAPASFRDAAPEDPRRRCPDISLARQLLGWQPEVDLSTGLAETLDWYRRHA